MNFYYITDENGFLVQQGTLSHPIEARMFREQFGESFHEGNPPGHSAFVFPPSQRHRWHVPTEAWVEIHPDADELWATVRYKRDNLIAETDWRATRSVVEKRRLHPAWAAYQQALRDITIQPDPANISWPELPTAPTFADQDPDQYPVLEGNAKFELFTDAERAAILSAALTDTAVMLLVNRITGAAFITYADPELEFGLTLLVNKELLTPERKAEIVVSLLPPSMQSV